MSLHAALSDSWVNESWRKTPEELWSDVCWSDMIAKAHKRKRSGGVMFARKQEAAGAIMTAKDEARLRIHALLQPARWMGHMRLLTMPGLLWKFEDYVLDLRRRKHAGITIYAVERDPAIWFGAIRKMPGCGQSIRQLSPHCIATHKISHFYLSTAESFITDPCCPEFDAAWLDFTGQMTLPLARAIKHFWRTKCVWSLSITSLNGRFHQNTNEQVKKHGGIVSWLTHYLGGVLADEFYYHDGAPMVQMTLEKNLAVDGWCE